MIGRLQANRQIVSYKAGMNFVALDFETANANLRSICQVGIVKFEDGKAVETFTSLVDPDDYFDPLNEAIHGINETTVRGAPTFQEIYPELRRRLQDAIVVTHTGFDRLALLRATSANNLLPVSCRWLDTTRVVRHVWPKYVKSGYGLANLTKDFAIQFKHHDAAEDAKATGIVLVYALGDSAVTIDEWLTLSNSQFHAKPRETISRHGDPQGQFAGEVIVFTGALSMPRQEAADMAAAAGFEVGAGVTKHTTLLVVGDQDIGRLAPGQTKSSKHLKAEALIAKGQPIRILCETDFREMVAI